MNTTSFALTAATWEQVSSGTAGSIYHQSGGKVLYTRADAQPSPLSPSSPIAACTTLQQYVSYSAPAGFSIWAIAPTTSAVITVTESV